METKLKRIAIAENSNFLEILSLFKMGKSEAQINFETMDIGDSNLMIIYAVVQNAVVGYLLYSVFFNQARIEDIFVCAKYRRCGIATDLYSELKSLYNIVLHSDSENRTYLGNEWINSLLRI